MLLLLQGYSFTVILIIHIFRLLYLITFIYITLHYRLNFKDSYTVNLMSARYVSLSLRSLRSLRSPFTRRA